MGGGRHQLDILNEPQFKMNIPYPNNISLTLKGLVGTIYTSSILVLKYELCTKIWEDIFHWIEDSTTSFFHLEIILISKPYHVQIRQYTCRISNHFATLGTCRKCHVSLDPTEHEYKLL